MRNSRCPRRPLVPLVNEVWALNRTRNRRERWAADSACGRWAFLRTPDGNHWVAIFLPTGQEHWFTGLADARAYAASPDTLALLRRQAQLVIDRGGYEGTLIQVAGRRVEEDPGQAAARVGEARRHIQTIDQLERQVSEHAT